jgi:ABC-type glycerol-3-phosphate transport system substrate-binding protein
MSRQISRRKLFARAAVVAAPVLLAACARGTEAPPAPPGAAKPAEPGGAQSAGAKPPAEAPKPAEAQPAKPAGPTEAPKPAAAGAPTTAPAAAATPTAAAGAPAAAPAGPTPTATPILAEAGKGSTVINFWNGLTGSDGQGMVRIVERWAQEDPDIQVKIQMIAWRTFYDKLSASLVAGNPPEMWIFHSEQVIRYSSKGLMKQIDDLAQGKTFPGQTIPITDMGYTLPFTQIEGKTWSVPLDQYTWALWYNKDIVKAAGLDPEKPPKSGEDFVQWGKQMTLDAGGKRPGESGFDPKNVKQWGFYYGSQAEMWKGIMLQLGAPHAMINGPEAKDVNTDSPEAIKALEEMTSWNVQHNFVPGPTGVNVLEGFLAGKVGMFYGGIWNVNAVKARPEIKAGVGVTPTWRGDKGIATFSGHQMCMPASLSGKKFEEAWKTIKYISDHTLDWAKEGQTPARKSILTSKEFQDLWPQSVFAQQLPIGRPIPPHLKLIELNDVMGPAVDSALNGQKKPDEALKDAAQRQPQVLARRD